MLLLLLLLAINFDFFETSYLHYQYDEDTTKRPTIPTIADIEFEPIVNIIKANKNIFYGTLNCDDFTKYALNCTIDSALIYNSSKKSPPMPARIENWCSAIRRLTNCAIDWNSECKDVTESHFNEESIKGHMHVVNNICDDEWFLTHYDDLPMCIDKVASTWESCYIAFKTTVEHHKNLTQEWTHYETHFHLCCARTQFRRCTLDALFLKPLSKCLHDEAVILQKFSVIISEGDVFQDCEHNMMYSNCPGGDPRPPTYVLTKLMNAETAVQLVEKSTSCASKLDIYLCMLVVFICLFKLCM